MFYFYTDCESWQHLVALCVFRMIFMTNSLPLHKYTKCALPTLEGEWGWVDVAAMCLMVLVRA